MWERVRERELTCRKQPRHAIDHLLQGLFRLHGNRDNATLHEGESPTKTSTPPTPPEVPFDAR